jgi:hypothetical protein
MTRVIVVVVVAMAALAGIGHAGEPSAPPPPSTTTPTTSVTTTPAHPAGMRCDACHTPAGWTPAKFAHEKTGYPLRGRHQGVACGSCHRRDWQDPLPQQCAGCHTDPHVQEFGLQCASCHSEDSFAPLFLVDAHRRTQFPLSGRHATLPCTECHVERRDRTFTRTALACVDCHGRDVARASTTTIDHRSLPTTCQGCHVPTTFSPARLAGHDVCFPLAGTVHAPVRCAECHDGRALVGARLTGACRGVAVRCAECHVHNKDVSDRQHQGVPGYAHVSDRCAGCHQAVR